ncbi:MAG: hypothetical protein ACXVCF_16990, partial [Isosphaeraceae bacterium]
MAISLDRLENPVILFGPVLRHHASGGLRAPRPPSRRWARQPFLRTDHPHVNLDLLALFGLATIPRAPGGRGGGSSGNGPPAAEEVASGHPSTDEADEDSPKLG